MARWKARIDFLLSVIELLFLSLTVEALQGKVCQNSLPLGGSRWLGATISGGMGRPPANIFIPLERQLIVLELAADSRLFGIEPWLMARWKARVRLSIRHNWTFSLALTVEALQGKTCQDSLQSGGGRSLGAKISEGRGRPWGIFFGFYKTRRILLSESANYTVLRAVVLMQYRRVTDGQTDG